MTELSTARGDGLDVRLTSVDDNDGRSRSLIALQLIDPDVFVALNNVEALALAHELISLAANNNDLGSGLLDADASMTASEALELHMLTRSDQAGGES